MSDLHDRVHDAQAQARLTKAEEQLGEIAEQVEELERAIEREQKRRNNLQTFISAILAESPELPSKPQQLIEESDFTLSR